MRTYRLCLLAALILSFFVAPVIYGRPIVVDADSSDWTLTPPSISNIGHISRDAWETGAYVWTDAQGDERTDFFSPDPGVDLTEFRITADPTGLYFLARFMDTPIEAGEGVVQLQVAIDLDRIPGSGQTWLGGFSETQVSAEAAWEHLVMTRFGSANPTPSVYDTAWMDTPLGAISALSPLTDCMEIFVPWEAIGGPPAAPLRFTVAAFRSDASDGTWEISGTSDALDAVTNYGDPGSAPNTWTEVGDGLIDSFFDVWFHLDPGMEPSPPLLITEVLYDPIDIEPDHEWFELYNRTDIPLDLTGYRIGDEEQPDAGEGMMAFPIGSFIEPGQVMVIASNAAEFASTWSQPPDYELIDSDPTIDDLTMEPLWASGSVVLRNAGDELQLLDACWTILDVATWGTGSYPGVISSPGCGQDESIARLDDVDTDDCANDFEALAMPTPGWFLGPVAGFYAFPNPAGCGQSVTFDAGPSHHQNPNRSITIYEWDFDIDGDFEPDAIGPVVDHAYPLFGYYTVALRVTDDGAAPQTDIETVVLDVVLGNTPPEADAGGPYTITLGNPLQLDGSGSVDPDEECGDAIAEFLWDLDNDLEFDDASGETPLISWATLSALGLSGQGNPVVLRIEDTLGAWRTDETTLDIDDSSDIGPEILPVAFGLHQNVPNPFNPSTTIVFDVPRPVAVDLRIFDISGRLVLTVLSGQEFEAGRHEAVWTGRDDRGRQVPTGTYFYSLCAGDFVETRRMTLLK